MMETLLPHEDFVMKKDFLIVRKDEIFFCVENEFLIRGSVSSI